MLKFTCCDAVTQFSKTREAQVLTGIVRGFERETLRVATDGHLVKTPHPAALGSKLTHPWITTDYSEALLEFITPPSSQRAAPLPFLDEVHRFTAQHLGDELMWAGSMPCVLAKDSEIPIANYGTSNKAKFKHVYREGLGLRYGRQMQTIAGVHYNWSLPEAFWRSLHACCESNLPMQDFVSDRYFGLIRNFLRYGWLVPYLFGASPALCTSFLRAGSGGGGSASGLVELMPGTHYGPFATSLRMSDLGYQNRAQASLDISFNSLAEYAQGLESAIRTPDPFYQDIGTHQHGDWVQLNTHLLQIENEFYAGMRPKRIGRERPALALRRYGVEYIEMRLFDVNPMHAVGVAPEQSDFADVLLLMCLFRDSPPISAREHGENDENKRRVVNEGRKPGLHLLVHNREQPFAALAHELFDDMHVFAQMLDSAYGGTSYSTTLQTLRGRIDRPSSTPSAQLLDAASANGGYFKHTMALSQSHKASLLANPLGAADAAKFAASVQASEAAQAKLEADEKGSFDELVAAYYAE